MKWRLFTLQLRHYIDRAPFLEKGITFLSRELEGKLILSFSCLFHGLLCAFFSLQSVQSDLNVSFLWKFQRKNPTPTLKRNSKNVKMKTSTIHYSQLQQVTARAKKRKPVSSLSANCIGIYQIFLKPNFWLLLIYLLILQTALKCQQSFFFSWFSKQIMTVIFFILI